MPATPTRRERLRAAALDEIHTTARRLLVAEGPAGVTLRAISREMGMTAPALYRYYAGLDELMSAMCALFYDECREHIEAAVAATDAPPADRIYTACRAFRRWSISHPAEFTMMFASTLGGRKILAKDMPSEQRENVQRAGMRFSQVFMRLFVEMWQRDGLRVPADDEVAPALREQFAAFLAENKVPLPVGAMQAFTSSWIRLYGMVALEVFGHLHFCMTDSNPMFETELAAIGRGLGVQPPSQD